MSSYRRSPEAVIRRLRTAGPRGVAEAVGRRTLEPARARVRARRLTRKPLAVGPDEVRRALGGVGLAEALRGSALRALPTVAAFEESLAGMDEETRRDLLARADQIVAHRFDLLGSGPTDLGPEIDWSADFLHGYRWPPRHSPLLPSAVPGADVKMPWELSRCQHLPLLAAAYRASGERAYLDELGAQLTSWIEANPVEFGVNWICTMDVAIRAANWVAALVIAAPEAAAEPWAERVAGSLLLHGRFIRAHPEWAPVRSNHYLSDVVGLLVVSALFAAGAEGAAWRDWAGAELLAEMEHEVRADGCGHEASIPYHRLVTELFLCGTQVLQASGRPLPASYTSRLDLMLDFVAAYTRPDGLAPQLGDNDDGRFLPLDDYGRADPRSHLHLFRQAGRAVPPPPPSTAFPDGGYYVLRAAGIYLLIRCGDTGLGGEGGHAHNDQLSFELCHRGEPLIEDPGAFRYAPDARLRKLFRSTGFHAALSPDGEEQNPLPEPPRFPLGDRTHAEALEWRPDDPRPSFVGRHHGFEHLPEPLECRRRFELDPAAARLTIVDRVAGPGSHRLEWAFPLAPSEGIVTGAGRTEVDFAATRLVIEAPGVEFEAFEGLYSPHYGAKEPRPFLRGRARSTPGESEFRFDLSLSDRPTRRL
ncbi:MAG: alginate lyase family protein [Actinobacteria bacterium]|nr:alginate lyase family protein [Actinomycetota bacterium]